MKKNKNSQKATSVRVPSWDPAVLNRDLLAGFADDPATRGTQGWAYREIGKFIGSSFPMGHNPLETLRKILPRWQWNVTEVPVDVSPWEGEIGHPAYCAYCAYCGNGQGGGYGEEELLAQWVYSATNDGRVFWVKATHPVKGLGFAAKTAGVPGKYGPQWELVDFNTPVGVEEGWNVQSYPHGHSYEGKPPGRKFRHFSGLVPAGTQPVPVEKIGEREWLEGSPWGSGEWGRSGYEADYLTPDGTVVTESVTIDEWP